ncbi:hypothetical protein ACVW1A_000737 [Bradyrhizobium sp. LB1.3]
MRHDETEPPGREQRIQRPLVETPHDQELDEDTDEPRRQRGQHLGNRERHTEIHKANRHIGTTHDELAVGHVDDAHHAEHNGEACGRKN